MIREVICYRCKCSKCGGEWVTKGHDLPFNCSKCKSRLWNDDYIPLSVSEAMDGRPTLRDIPVVPSLSGGIMNPALQKFLSQNDGEPPVIVTSTQPDEWRFTKDKPQFADDGNVYRLQCLVSDPRKTRTVRVEELDHDEILSVNKKR